jgi:hypothetical protein
MSGGAERDLAERGSDKFTVGCLTIAFRLRTEAEHILKATTSPLRVWKICAQLRSPFIDSLATDSAAELAKRSPNEVYGCSENARPAAAGYRIVAQKYVTDYVFYLRMLRSSPNVLKFGDFIGVLNLYLIAAFDSIGLMLIATGALAGLDWFVNSFALRVAALVGTNGLGCVTWETHATR